MLRVEFTQDDCVLEMRVLEQDKRCSEFADGDTFRASDGFMLLSIGCPQLDYGYRMYLRGDTSRDDYLVAAHRYESPEKAAEYAHQAGQAIAEYNQKYGQVAAPVVTAPIPTPASLGVKVETGERRQFSTGATRQASAGKGKPTLVSPIAMRELSIHCEEGGVTHGDRNWETGLPLCAGILDSLMRHVNQEIEGDISEAHDRAILWNAMAYVHTKRMIQRGLLPAELDDRPNYVGGES